MLLAGYLFTTLCAKFMLNLGVGKPPSIGLRPKDMPAGQRLRLKSRRRSEGGLCKGYSAVEDPYFVPYGGDYCGTMTYEAKPTGAPAGAEAEQLQKIELTYKAFETDEHAKEYFWRFWGIHSHSIMPSSFYVDVSQKLPSVGDEHRALYYNPGLMMHSPGDNTFQAAHMLYFNRVGRTVMVLSISGFAKVQTTMINPELAQGLASAVEQRIVYPWKWTAQVRHFAKSVLRLGHRLEARINRVFNLGEKLADQVDAGIKDLSKHVAEEASRRSAEAFMRIDKGMPGASVSQRVPDGGAGPVVPVPMASILAGDARAGAHDAAFWPPKEAVGDDEEGDEAVGDTEEGDEGAEFGLWDGAEENETATTMVASRWNDSEDFGAEQPVLVAQALRPVRVVLEPETAVAAEKSPYRQPLYFGQDWDPSDELDYQGVETDSQEGETGAECGELLRALRVLQLSVAPGAECQLPPIVDLGVSATVITLVFLLIGAGEIIDPRDYDPHGPALRALGASRLLSSK